MSLENNLNVLDRILETSHRLSATLLPEIEANCMYGMFYAQWNPRPKTMSLVHGTIYS